MNNYFEGHYYKHQKDGKTVAIIPGSANNLPFVQIITNNRSYNFDFQDNCIFSTQGIMLDLPNIYGEIKYSNLTPIAYDIMGPFKYFPMECRHKIISMYHNLDGKLKIDGEIFDFTGGIGYIEKDSGRSFPKEYLWIQCNNFNEKCSIMASVAHIPFMKLNFTGCICVIIYGGKEYRLATYLGVKIICANKNKLILAQGKYKLEIYIEDSPAHPLKAPKCGSMTEIIHESNNATANFRFSENGKILFEFKSENASFEIRL